MPEATRVAGREKPTRHDGERSRDDEPREPPARLAGKTINGIPRIQASGGPRRVIASTRERSSGLAHSAVAAIAAEYETPMPIPVTPWASASTAKSGAAALSSEPQARTTMAPRSSPRRPTRVASRPTRSAERPAAKPDTVRSWPAVAIDTSRSRATSGSRGLRTTSAACDAVSAANSVPPMTRGPSRIRE